MSNLSWDVSPSPRSFYREESILICYCLIFLWSIFAYAYYDPNLYFLRERELELEKFFQGKITYLPNTQIQTRDPLGDLALEIKERYGAQSPFYIKAIIKIVRQETLDGKVNPCLILGIIGVESSFKELDTFTPYGQGPMQVTRIWANEFNIKEEQLLNPAINIPIGISILTDYYQEDLDKYNGNGTKGYKENVYKHKDILEEELMCQERMF